MDQVIDIHTHLFAPGPTVNEANPDEMRTMLRLAGRFGIRRAVALGNVTLGGATPTQEQITSINNHTLSAMKAHPEFFIGFCYLNPGHPESFLLGEIERCVVKGGMLGLKLWVAVKATDRCHDPMMRRAQELDIPILYHAWYKAFDQGAGESTPAEMADLARRFPKVTIVMAHLTGDGERGVHDIRDCGNVLIDTSGGQPESALVEYAVKKLGGDRVIYGSDWPIRDFGVQIGRVLGACIRDDDREKILRRNAERVLKIASLTH